MSAGETNAYTAAMSAFRWPEPERFNIGVDVCDRWADADPHRVAIIEFDERGLVETTFAQLKTSSNRVANLLVAKGMAPGDRVAVFAPQRVETAVAHIAIYKAGGIAVPLFNLFGADALVHRLKDSEARFLFCDAAGVEKIDALRSHLPHLETIVVFDEGSRRTLEEMSASYSDDFMPVDTLAEDPALIIYTSGTTGPSKGALHAHRVLLGHLPGVEMSHGGFPRAGDRIWTPADWAWIGGLLDVLLPALHHGVPVVAHRFAKFEAAAAFQLMQDCGVRNAFLPPTALKLLRQEHDPRGRWTYSLRSVASGGESLGGELLDWAKDQLGVTLNEFYGQTECNMIVSSCSEWFAPKPGIMGKPAPGHQVSIVDGEGAICPPDVEGDIAVLSPDPVMFLGYWRNPDATAEKFRGDWLITGDRGVCDADGSLRFVGRSDDVITSAGYRIGPGEVEDCLLAHPAVALAGVIGRPDTLRTEVVTAFVVLRDAFRAGDELKQALQNHVRLRLGGHQYPREVIFTDSLPMTVTGKIVRRELRARALEAISR